MPAFSTGSVQFREFLIIEYVRRPLPADLAGQYFSTFHLADGLLAGVDRQVRRNRLKPSLRSIY
jgi:hypothetical protein